jgi:hypothetical protein
MVLMLVLLVVGMLVWARGPQHHHGQYVGAQGRVGAFSLERQG